ncbi:MAG: acyl carrier protein [Flavobacterium sp.]
MSLEIFLDGFRSQFDETAPELIQNETVYKELDEWSSMMALVIIAFVDDEYNVTLTGDDFGSTKTVEDLFNLINSK